MITCNGDCLNCPYPEMPRKCCDAPIAYDELLELREMEKDILFPKTDKQKRRAATQHKYYINNREECRTRTERWRDQNREHYDAQQKQYREEHKAEIAAYKKAYWAKHGDEYNKKRRQRYRENREHELKRRKAWRDKNPSYGRDYYAKNKRKVLVKRKNNKKKYGSTQAVIREARIARRWRKIDLAEHCGASVSTIRNWEHGLAPANWDVLYQVMPELKEMGHEMAAKRTDSNSAG